MLPKRGRRCKACYPCVTESEIFPKSPLSPNSPFSPKLWGPSNWVNLFALIISSTTLAKFRQNRYFCQIRRFRQICQHFRALLTGLIYSLLLFRQLPWRNFARIAIFATACISGPISFDQGLCQIPLDRQTDMFLFGVLYKESTLTTISK